MRVLVGALLGLLLASGCAQQLTPQDVADRFWRAVVTGHAAKIKRYVVSADREQLAGDAEVLPVVDYRLGRVVIDAEFARIETHVTLGGDKPLPLTIDTRLVLEQNSWRVDYSATVDAISARSNLAEVIGEISRIGETLQEGIEQSVDELNRAVPKIEQELSRIESQIKQRMPELREQLEAFSKRIEEALKAPPSDPPTTTEDGTIAL